MQSQKALELLPEPAMRIARHASSIRSKDTKPELMLKKAIRDLGFLYHPKIVGKLDFAHRKKKVAVFVHGCFWHNCPRPKCHHVVTLKSKTQVQLLTI